jgi:hypothetical protein
MYVGHISLPEAVKKITRHIAYLQDEFIAHGRPAEIASPWRAGYKPKWLKSASKIGVLDLPLTTGNFVEASFSDILRLYIESKDKY